MRENKWYGRYHFDGLEMKRSTDWSLKNCLLQTIHRHLRIISIILDSFDFGSFLPNVFFKGWIQFYGSWFTKMTSRYISAKISKKKQNVNFCPDYAGFWFRLAIPSRGRDAEVIPRVMLVYIWGREFSFSVEGICCSSTIIRKWTENHVLAFDFLEVIKYE